MSTIRSIAAAPVLDRAAAAAAVRAAPADIPESCDIVGADALRAAIAEEGELPYSLIAAGDVMLGGRTRARIEEHGEDYPFAGVSPLLRHAAIVLVNLEGPLARDARREDRRFSYKVDPALAGTLARAGINVAALPNNHLMDCGRAGVLETLASLRAAGVAPLGGGENARAAHQPVIMRAGRVTVGMLAYYWNRRCAATAKLPGGAMDTADELRADIGALRSLVDRVVVSFHWGVPYDRDPSADDRAKARLAIELGADVVVGHHPHIVQPMEIYRGRPIFYSVGNFAFGSGNSLAESLLLAVRFEDERTVVDAWPLYVKNRDLRVDYQPKTLRGDGSRRALERLVAISGESGRALEIRDGRARLVLAADGGRTGG